MALVLKGGAVFLHIPKTGGNWVTAVLRECGLVEGSIGTKHADINRVLFPSMSTRREIRRLRVLKRFVKRLLFYSRDKPFMFCFVRHPLTWYESWFKYMSQSNCRWRNWGDEKDINRWHPGALLNGLGDSSFNQFVRNVIGKRPGYVTELYGWYTAPEVDFVGKQENLREDLIQVLNILNLEFDEDFVRNFRKVGVSPQEDKITWDPDLREEVLKLEYAGIVRYGYLSSESR